MAAEENSDFFFGRKLIFFIDLKSQKKIGQSDMRSRSNSPSREEVAPLGADRVKRKVRQVLFKESLNFSSISAAVTISGNCLSHITLILL